MNHSFSFPHTPVKVVVIELFKHLCQLFSFIVSNTSSSLDALVCYNK